MWKVVILRTKWSALEKREITKFVRLGSVESSLAIEKVASYEIA